MSGPRSRSPHYRMNPRRHEDTGGHFRRFPWDDPDFDLGFADLGRMPFDGKRHPREDTEQQRASYRQDTLQGGQRRPRLSPDPHRPGHLRHPPPEKFYRRTPPPHPRELGYNERRAISPEQALPRHNGEGARDGGRGGFREDFQSFENRERPAHSPQRPARERVPSLPLAHSSHQQRDPSAGWRRDDQARGLKRPRDGSPRRISDHLGRGEGRERGRGDTQAPYRERQREDLHHERSPYLDSQMRQIDDALHPGYRKEEAFRGRHRSLERPTDGFGGGPGEHRGTQGGFPHRESQASGPLIVEHDHGNMDSKGPVRWEKHEGMRSRGPDREREVHPRQRGPSQERFRKSNSRSDTREETRGRPVFDTRRDFGHEPRRSPIRQDRTSPMNFPGRGGRGGPLNHRGKGSPGPARGRRNPGREGRMEMGPSRNHPRSQQFPQGRQDPPQKQPGFQPREENWDVDLHEGEPHWAEKKPVLPQREGDRPGTMGRLPPRDGMEPGMSRHRERWNHPQNTSEMTVVTEETLTIKVDMKRPTNQNSSQLCYSTDRQLSLDLVNVGRQRLDFLPMLEHSGTYQESTMHTGTFAQEIIQLVHQVKEYYFRGDGITLNERFSAPQEGGSPEDEEEDDDEEVEEEEVVEERPSLNRRFNMNMNALPDPEPLFSRLGRMESPGHDLLRDPGDLRHDLERRRQERLEGVKVTIPGGSLSQHPLGPGSEQHVEYDDDDDVSSGEQGGPEQGRRWTGGTGPRRGGPFRQNPGPQRRNNRPPNHPGNHMGPMRRPNNHNNIVGSNW